MKGVGKGEMSRELISRGGFVVQGAAGATGAAGTAETAGTE